MKSRIALCILILTTILSSNGLAEIYRSVDDSGAVTFSDQPSQQAKPLSLQPSQITTTYKPPLYTTKTSTATDAASQMNSTDITASAQAKKEYETFAISSPQDQETFQNAESIPVSLTISPALQGSDKIILLFDGTAFAESTGTSAVIPKVLNNAEFLTRGSHTIQANIVDAQGNTIKSTPSITIFAHYTSLEQQKNMATQKTGV